MTKASILLLLFIVPAYALAQFRMQPGGKLHPLGKDTFCFGYDIRAGDTLRYYVKAQDSVIVEGGQTFSKFRTEMMRLVCDSVSANGRMFLAYTLLHATERHISNSDTSVRNTSPWIGRTQQLSIDKLGHRSDERSDNELLAGASPGGIFPPMLLPIIDTACGPENKTWLSIDTVLLVENAVPIPLLVQQNLWRVGKRLDTMGCTAAQIQYSHTGAGWVTLKSKDLTLETTTSLAGFGRLTFDLVRSMLLHQFATVENKFTMNVPPDIKVKGRHMITQYVTLVELTSPDRSRCWKAPSVKTKATTNRSKNLR